MPRVYNDMFTFHPELTATQMVLEVYYKLWVDTTKQALPLKKGEPSTDTNKHKLWNRNEYYERLIAFNNAEYKRLKKNKGIKAEIERIERENEENGIEDDVSFEIDSVKDLRNKNLHGGSPRFTQLFTYAITQLIKHINEDDISDDDVKTIKSQMKMPTVHNRAQKSEVNFASFLNDLKGKYNK